MAAKILRSLAVSAFCEDMAMMLAAGIQVDDALSLMRGDSGDGPLYDAASAVLERVQMGEPLAEAVEQCGYFPAYAAQLVAAGEAAGRTESVLKSLAVYYETQDKLEKRLKSAVIYPAVLLFLMAGVLGRSGRACASGIHRCLYGAGGKRSGFFLCVHHGCKYHRLGISVPGHRADGAFAYRCGCGAHAAWERPVPHVV